MLNNSDKYSSQIYPSCSNVHRHPQFNRAPYFMHPKETHNPTYTLNPKFGNLKRRRLTSYWYWSRLLKVSTRNSTSWQWKGALNSHEGLLSLSSRCSNFTQLSQPKVLTNGEMLHNAVNRLLINAGVCPGPCSHPQIHTLLTNPKP